MSVPNYIYDCTCNSAGYAYSYVHIQLNDMNKTMGTAKYVFIVVKCPNGFFVSGVTILLSLTVFLNMVAETMPATSDAVPLLGKQ